MEKCKTCNNVVPSGCGNGLCADHCEGGCGVHKGGGKAALAKKKALLEKLMEARREREKEREEKEKSAEKASSNYNNSWRRYTKKDEDEEGAKNEEEELLKAIEASKNENLFKGFTWEPESEQQEITATPEQISMIQAILPDYPEEQVVMALKLRRGDTERAIDFLLSQPPKTSTTTTTTTTTTSSSLLPEPRTEELEEEEPVKPNLLTAEEFKTLKPKKQVKMFLELQKKVESLLQERTELKTTVNKQQREIHYVTGGYGFEVWKNLQKETVAKLQATFATECVVCLEDFGKDGGLFQTSCGCKVVCKSCYRLLKRPRHCPQCNKPIK